jgi:hypothetical protein
MDGTTPPRAPAGPQEDERAAQGPADPPHEEGLDEELHDQLAHLTVQVAPVANNAATFIEADAVRLPPCS